MSQPSQSNKPLSHDPIGSGPLHNAHDGVHVFAHTRYASSDRYIRLLEPDATEATDAFTTAKRLEKVEVGFPHTVPDWARCFHRVCDLRNHTQRPHERRKPHRCRRCSKCFFYSKGVLRVEPSAPRCLTDGAVRDCDSFGKRTGDEDDAVSSRAAAVRAFQATVLVLITSLTVSKRQSTDAIIQKGSTSVSALSETSASPMATVMKRALQRSCKRPSYCSAFETHAAQSRRASGRKSPEKPRNHHIGC